ncbi:PIN domain-containing protein [soil metagenome]
MVDALVVAGPAGDAGRTALAPLRVLTVPAMFGAEVTSGLRGMVQRGELTEQRARVALRRVRSARTIRYPFEPFAARVWELRHSISVYDGWYVALAEWLDTTLLTADERLLSASGPRCRVEPPV